MDNAGQDEVKNDNQSSQNFSPLKPSSSLGLFIILILVIVAIISYTIFKKTNIASKLFNQNATPTVTVTPTPTPEEGTNLGEINIPTGYAGKATPTPTGKTTATATPTPQPVVINADLKAINNKVFLGENETYAAYIINTKSSVSPEKGGQLALLNKNEDQLTKVSGFYVISAPVTVLDNGVGNFVSLTFGKDANKKNMIISLSTKKQIINTFCSLGQPTFWNSFLLYSNCATFQNRPWVGNFAPSLVAINLKVRTFNTFLKSDLTKHFSIKDIKDSTLSYYQTALDSGTDWSKKSLTKTTTQEFDLTTLK